MFEKITSIALRALADLGFFSDLTQKRKNKFDWDVALLEEFTKLLPSDGKTIGFLRSHNIGNSFPGDILDPLDVFLNCWNNAEKEFNDTEMESKKEEMHKLGISFRNKLTERIRPSYIDGWFDVGVEDYESNPDVLEYVKEMNECISKMFDLHQDLIRIGKKKGMANNKGSS